MRSIIRYAVSLSLLLIPCAAQQQWEIGGALGYGIYKNQKVSSDTVEGTAGFRHGLAFSINGGQDLYRYIGGEIRYTYRANDLKLNSEGTNVRFSGEAHAIHYDLLLNTAPKGSRIRPFVALGGGVKVFRGTDRESEFQPLNRLALLTRTHQVKPLISLGAGVRIALSRNAILRLDIRDYITPFPDEVIVPVPPTRLNGWLHDFVPMIGVGFVF